MSNFPYPEVTVGALIFNKEGEVFLMKSPKWRGKYTVPGGHIELGETAEEALKREIKEETGLDIYDVSFLHIQESVFGDEFYKKKHFVLLDYICKTKGSDAVLDNREGTEYVWVTINEALKLPLCSYTKELVLEYKDKFLK
jgi:nucleoside triphosphatase